MVSAHEHARQNHDGTLGLLKGVHSSDISLEIFPHKWMKYMVRCRHGVTDLGLPTSGARRAGAHGYHLQSCECRRGPFRISQAYCCKVSLVMLEGTSSCQHVRQLPDGSHPTPQEPCGLRNSTTVSPVVRL